MGGKSGSRDREPAASEPVNRRVDGFVWLARHTRRRDIVAFVRGTKDVPPDWLSEDRVWPKVQRDRAIWKALHPDDGTSPSLREVSDALKARGVSHQMVANVRDVYQSLDGPKPPTKDTSRLKLRKLARKAVTREVIAQFDAGELTAVHVADLIGGGADHRNAVYWIGRMRELYAEQDAPNQKPARKRW